jgi:hypothetical protein
MTIQNGERDGKNKNGLRLVHGSGSEVFSLTDIPEPIAESLRQQCSEEIAVLFRRANVSPALIYAFSKTGLLVTEENRDRLPLAEYRERTLDFPDDGGIARPRPRGAFLRSGGRTRRHANPKSIWGSCSGATACRRSVCSLRNDVCRRTASGSPASDGILLDSPKWVKPDRLLYKILYKNRPGF